MFCCCPCCPLKDDNDIDRIMLKPEPPKKYKKKKEKTKIEVKDSYKIEDENLENETNLESINGSLIINSSSSSTITSSWNQENPNHIEINIQFRHQTKKIKVKKKYKLIKIATKFIESESKSENISFEKVQFSYHGEILNLGKTLEELGISQDDTLELI